MLIRSPVRSVCLLALVCSACFGTSKATDGAHADDTGSNSVGGAPAFCDVDDDCALAAPTCCACPSFAVSASDGSFDASCKDVTCPMPDGCPAMVARCIESVCAATCAPVTCDVSCADGFVADAAGCLTCACHERPANGCHADEDCVEVPADCCGCARGGSDTAVLAGDAAVYAAMLGCPASPNCPDFDTCEPAAIARCLQGSCTLTTTTHLPAGSCGRPDLATCAACVLNASPDATALGVGICGMP
jgi:hypothetical protein